MWEWAGEALGVVDLHRACSGGFVREDLGVCGFGHSFFMSRFVLLEHC